MKRMCFSRFATVLLAAGLVLASPLANAFAAPQQDPNTADARFDMSLKVYALRHTDAHEAAAILQDQLGGLVRITPDARTNSLIISGRDVGHEKVAAILSEIDVPLSEVDGESRTVVLDTRDLARQMNLASIIDLLRIERTDRAALQSDGTIVLQGSARSIDAANDLIDTLRSMHSDKPAASSERTLRVVWLISDHADGPEPGADLKPVVTELAQLGITNLRIGAQALVQARENGKFEVTSVGDVNGPCEFSVRGFLRADESGIPIASIEVYTESLPPDHVEETAESFTTRGLSSSIQTEIACPDGHFIVLGAAPTGPRTSVFIVQSHAAR